MLKLRQNAFAVQVCSSTLQWSGNDKTLGAVLGPEDAAAVGLAEAPLLDDGQDDGRLFVVKPDEIVMNFSEEVLWVPQRLILRILQHWSWGQLQGLLAVDWAEKYNKYKIVD